MVVGGREVVVVSAPVEVDDVGSGDGGNGGGGGGGGGDGGGSDGR